MREHRVQTIPRTAVMASLALFGLSACVKVQAPDKPIEINLNVNIKQEVVIRLEKDVRDLIKNNPAVF
ncbi:YnbE family lipoprotein [Hankyongella ginsenosidimutans]|mgnify:CR=1 FL=1|uniref:YnbE family lipoprotein n=2 Tax=Hankyongella ginsenosidimutans TaxID=1763828 RepID=A0A4D7C8X5_9SPHN|nr:YnbE family lipoprotein [Hankyongella ginsenosidimutans]TXG84699.1 MAG: YnbE family lipoprotein [Sphingomonadales bacterium]